MPKCITLLGRFYFSLCVFSRKICVWMAL